jgi:hypothetical protein
LSSPDFLPVGITQVTCACSIQPADELIHAGVILTIAIDRLPGWEGPDGIVAHHRSAGKSGRQDHLDWIDSPYDLRMD